MALPPAVVEQSTGKVLTYISTKLDEKASRAHTIVRIEIAVSRLELVLEKTGNVAITSVALLRRWKIFKRLHMEGMDLLNKYKPRQEELVGQVVVRSSSYLHRFAKRAANLSISSLVGLVNENLSPSVAENFESYADCAEKFVADVNSICPLRHDTFHHPFLRNLFEGKTLFHERMKGKQKSVLLIQPVILEGRGVEAILGFQYLDPDRLDKSFLLILMLRISESTDIVWTAINCLRSSASLLNPVAKDAERKLTTLLHNSHDISYSFDSRWVQGWYAGCTKSFRSDAICCQAVNEVQEHSVNSIISSELPQRFPEETIMFALECYVPMPECRMASVSDEAHRNAMVHRRGRPQPLVIRYAFARHSVSSFIMEANWIVIFTLSKKEGHRHADIVGNSNNVQEVFDMSRLAVIQILTDEPEAVDCGLQWISKHGWVFLQVERPGESIGTAPKASGRYNTRSAKKRKM